MVTGRPKVFNRQNAGKKNDLKKINLDYGSDNMNRMTVRVKANRSSAFRNNMDCRNCDTGQDESQEHLRLSEKLKDMDVSESLEAKKEG